MIPKFRAWLKEENKMIEPSDILSISFKLCEMTPNYLHGFEKEKYDFYDLELMQSTGLLDKNGREIFEGDIVKRYRSPFFKAEWEYLIETVVREKASLLLGRDFGKNFGTLPFDSPFAKENLLEVIGNVHENPELLEVTE